MPPRPPQYRPCTLPPFSPSCLQQTPTRSPHPGKHKIQVRCATADTSCLNRVHSSHGGGDFWLLYIYLYSSTTLNKTISYSVTWMNTKININKMIQNKSTSPITSLLCHLVYSNHASTHFHQCVPNIKRSDFKNNIPSLSPKHLHTFRTSLEGIEGKSSHKTITGRKSRCV